MTERANSGTMSWRLSGSVSTVAYDLGNPELDATVRDLVAQATENPNGDLITEMLTTVLKLHRDGAPAAVKKAAE